MWGGFLHILFVGISYYPHGRDSDLYLVRFLGISGHSPVESDRWRLAGGPDTGAGT